MQGSSGRLVAGKWIKDREKEGQEMDNVFELKCEYGIVDAACQCEVCRLQREETDVRRQSVLRELAGGEDSKEA